MIIIHRCLKCSHPDTFHSPIAGVPNCSYGFCKCHPQYGPPEIIPSWDSSLTGRSELITIVQQPGTQWTTHNNNKTCGCDQCWELYDG